MPKKLKCKLVIQEEYDNVDIEGNILGVIEYGTKNDYEFSKDKNKSVPYQFVQVENISHNFTEIWYTNEEVEYLEGSSYVGRSDNYCFVSVNNKMDKEYRHCSIDAYESLLDKFSQDTYTIIRFWNYIPYINESVGDEDVYKEFCNGREKVFMDHFVNDSSIYPAATGIGCKGNILCVALIAVSKQFEVKNIENPRQISAFLYPKIYGKSSPKFSRATYFKNEKEQLIMISGTASIIGSETIGLNDVAKQTITTIQNILILLAEANLEKYKISNDIGDRSLKYLKVYIKNWEDYAIVRKICEDFFVNQSIIYLQNDICRKDLLVEIEGTLWEETD